MTLSKTPDRRPVGIDLFAGAGGLSLGFEQAGFDIAAAVEIDPVHCAVHEYNFPETTTICASVENLTGTEIRRRAKLASQDIDVVFGGAPCQGFSMIGKRALDDPRNGLVFHYVRLVRELRPKYCVFENVKGLTLGRHRQFLDELVDALGGSGYDVLTPHRVLNAADFGVPQNRHRLFLIGARRDMPLPEYPAPTTKTSVAEAIGDLPNADAFPELAFVDSVKAVFATASPFARKMRCLDPDETDFGYRRDFDRNILTASLRTEHTELSKRRFAETEHGKTEPISRFHKLAPHGFCNTLRAGTDSARGAFTSPRPIHPYFPRVVTVREAARLHSYPDWFRFHVTKWHGFRQIGNSVPPLLGRAVAGCIVRAMGLAVATPDRTIVPGEGRSELLSFDMGEAAAYFGVPATVIAQRTRKSARCANTEEISFA